ncbi:MAG: rhodanese-like domain-containing protein [Paraglaciecola sp.]|nr:rhodanese-like domain-containing protein [Paraglaciecola sp.]
MFKQRVCMGFLLLFVSTLCLAQQQQPKTELLDAFIIDVRTQAEWQEGHLVQARLIPWQEIVEEVASLKLDKNQPIALFCRSGNRASKAMALLNEAGYSKVRNLGSLEQAAEVLNQDIVK